MLVQSQPQSKTPIRFILKLKSDAPPHLFINQIMDLVRNDTELTTPFKNSMKLLAKKRQAFIELPLIYEIIIYPGKTVMIERGLKPIELGWQAFSWTEKDKLDFEDNSAKFIELAMEAYKKLGYFIDETDNVSESECDKILSKIKYWKKK